VRWRTVAVAVVGTAHVERGEACQDECWSSGADADRLFLSIFVADGAGSASHGGTGARLAIEAALAHLDARVDGAEPASERAARGCFSAARARLTDEAATLGVAVRELACTFLGVLSTPEASVVFQIGDGAIAVDVGEGLSMPIAPMNGAYINTTRFLVDEDASEALEVVAFERPVLRAAAVSDGLQGIATQMADHTPHEPFFAPFFRALASDDAEGRDDELHAAFAAFLGGERVNEKTDDDKSLAVAVAVA